MSPRHKKLCVGNLHSWLMLHCQVGMSIGEGSCTRQEKQHAFTVSRLTSVICGALPFLEGQTPAPTPLYLQLLLCTSCQPHLGARASHLQPLGCDLQTLRCNESPWPWEFEPGCHRMMLVKWCSKNFSLRTCTSQHQKPQANVPEGGGKSCTQGRNNSPFSFPFKYRGHMKKLSE